MTVAVIISSFFSGLLTAMGFGGGTVLIIYLTSFLSLEQKQAQGINLIFFIFTGFFAVISNSKKGLIDKKAMLSIIPFALIGLAAGFILLQFTPAYLLKKIFGGVLLILGLKAMFENKK